MKDNWKIGVLVCMFTVGVCAVVVGLVWCDVGEVSDCVVVRPLEAVSGHIVYPGLHRVLYRGTTKVSGEDCTEAIWVTKSEYERVMYGREN